MNSCTKIQSSHRRGGGVRDERDDHQPAPARDEPRNDPGNGDVLNGEVATHPTSHDILPPKRIEQSLRDAGLSARQAKRLMSGGYSAYAGNVDPDEADAVLAEALNFYRTLSEYIP